MSTKKGKTCRLYKNGRMTECAAMEQALGNVCVNDRVKGLVPVESSWITKEKLMRIIVGVSYRSSASDPGIMLNVCPWCSGDLGVHLDHRKAKETP